jgi:hypothetical protein
MTAPKGFRSAGLNASVTFGTLQYRAHQHNNKLELEEAKCEITSVQASSSQAGPDGTSSIEAYHQQQAQPSSCRFSLRHPAKFLKHTSKNNLRSNQI